VHFFIDTGSDGLAAAFWIQLVDVGNEHIDLATQNATRGIDFFDGYAEIKQYGKKFS